ncbi:MAG: ABC transporter permease [Verrucomicrobiota bacterium]|nr:ABC transporter permease [Verrucomicrobiota bacterium]MDG1890612.1 ABC transporter permease [Verrucomicrobiota bacterium]
MIRSIGAMAMLGMEVFFALPHLWRQRGKVLSAFFDIGNASLLMSCILSFFIGGVLALQSGPVLVDRGLPFVIGQLVGLSMCKELAPVMMAILIAGRVGSAMTAELASMQVYQEIDALKTMKINPVHYLVLPRMVAITLALPILVIFAILVGWLGGGFVSVVNEDIAISYQSYMQNLRMAVGLPDVAHGIAKSAVFALVIGLVSCYQGLHTSGGPRAIGLSVTQSVVKSIVFILILDYFITRLFVYLE